METKDCEINIESVIKSVQADSFPGIIELFQKSKKLAVIEGGSYEEFKSGPWPSSPGVYLIYQSEFLNPVYIGMTGKLKRGRNNILEYNSGKLKHRFLRWTPYKFQKEGEFQDHLQCIPTKKEIGDYVYNFPLSTIRVYCLSMDGMEYTLSPSFLEAILLQHFVEVQKALPLVNQEF